jgi:hypothetical protein
LKTVQKRVEMGILAFEQILGGPVHQLGGYGDGVVLLHQLL